MDLTVIIPNYNGETVLENCLKSLEHQDCSFKVIIVDNASIDGSIEIVKKKYPHHKIISNEANLGFTTAINQGIKATDSEYVFLLNNDVQLDSNCIKTLFRAIKSDMNLFAVTPKLIQADDHTKMDDAGDEYTLFGWSKRVGYGKSPELYNKAREPFSACAAASIYRKKVLEEIDYFDENFFAYMEDIDLSYRARLKGYYCYYCPEAVAYHKGSATSGSRYNEFKVRISARNNIYVPYKNMPWPQLLLNGIFLLVGFFIKYLFFHRMGYGRDYIKGLREGLNTLDKIEKARSINLKVYWKIEFLLIKNTLLFLII
jgi:GT2 family glycosyltransferase